MESFMHFITLHVHLPKSVSIGRNRSLQSWGSPFHRHSCTISVHVWEDWKWYEHLQLFSNKEYDISQIYRGRKTNQLFFCSLIMSTSLRKFSTEPLRKSTSSLLKSKSSCSTAPTFDEYLKLLLKLLDVEQTWSRKYKLDKDDREDTLAKSTARACLFFPRIVNYQHELRCQIFKTWGRTQYSWNRMFSYGLTWYNFRPSTWVLYSYCLFEFQKNII